MPLTSGVKLGPYEIVAPAGAGGMGEVYQARDTRLDRTVAIKILPADRTSEPALRERMEREAKAISKLSHSNICALYDIGHQDGTDYLVMEFLEGETLERRLQRGPISPEHCARYAAQIADALVKAHKLGIIHRDLKPSNIMLTKSGVKLMDFGLAKQSEVSPLADALTEMTASERKLTGEGTIVGTFQYMAPEQLEGKPVDGRTDIFALGEVIYEMATAKPAFDGNSRASLIAAILTANPPPISQLQPLAPVALDRVVKKCLEKEPDDRWQSAADLASELRWIAEGHSSSSAAQPAIAGRPLRRYLVPVLAAIALLSTAALMYTALHQSAPQRVLVASLLPPENMSFNLNGDNSGPAALSPDGSAMVVSIVGDGKSQLYIRHLGQGTSHALNATEGAVFPFWSPDSRSIGFFAEGKLKRMDVDGGAPVTLCDAPSPRGGSWGPNNTIIFTPAFTTGISRVSADGSTPVEITHVDTTQHTTHRFPSFLSDGKHFVYLAADHNAPSGSNNAVYVASLDGNENKMLFPSVSNAIEASGQLLFLRDGALMAQRFDASSLSMIGTATTLYDGVQFDATVWHGDFSASQNGVLVFQPGHGKQGNKISSYDRSGRLAATVREKEYYRQIELSHDGKRLAMSAGEPVGALWIYDLVGGVNTRMTFDTVRYSAPVWSPDDQQIAYSYVRPGTKGSALARKPTSGGGAEEVLIAPQDNVILTPDSWSPDGRFLIYERFETKGNSSPDLWALPLTGDKKPFPYLASPHVEQAGQFSPDGRWVAYVSSETGSPEIFVSPFPWTGARWQVSTVGGAIPRWRKDGKELFYLEVGQDKIDVAEVDGSGTSFKVLGVKPLFKLETNGFDRLFVVSPDGQKFIAITSMEENYRPLTIVENWYAESKSK